MRIEIQYLIKQTPPIPNNHHSPTASFVCFSNIFIVYLGVSLRERLSVWGFQWTKWWRWQMPHHRVFDPQHLSLSSFPLIFLYSLLSSPFLSLSSSSSSLPGILLLFCLRTISEMELLRTKCAFFFPMKSSLISRLINWFLST